MEKYCVLYNPKADNGRAQETAHRLEEILRGSEIEYVDITALGGYYDYFVSRDEDCRVILVGGDGTLNRFVNETRGLDIKHKIYFYGAGSGNDFLHDLGKEKGDAPFEVGKYLRNLPSVTVNGKEILFVNNVGFGIDGYCCEEGDRQREKSSKKTNYTTIAIKGVLFDYEPTDATVTIDGVTKKYRKVWLAPTMNGRYFGGGMKITPEQDRLDPEGSLSFAIAHSLGRLRLLSIFPSIFEGKHVKHTDVIEIRKCHSVHVRFNRPTALQIDGETIVGVTEYSAISSKLTAEKYSTSKVN